MGDAEAEKYVIGPVIIQLTQNYAFSRALLHNKLTSLRVEMFAERRKEAQGCSASFFHYYWHDSIQFGQESE